MFHEFNAGATVTSNLTADTVTIPTERLTRQKGILALMLIFTTVQFQHVTKIVVKVNEVIKFDMTPAEFRVYLQRYAKRFNSAAYPANGDLAWTIPFYLLELDEGDPRKWSQQLMEGPISIEISKSATPAAGVVNVSWVWTNQAAATYLEVTRHAIGIGASNGGEDKFFNLEGSMKGYIMNTTGVTELTLEINVSQDEKNPDWRQIFKGSGAQMIEMERLEDGSAATDPLAKRLASPVVTKLKVRLVTSGTWAGTGNAIVPIRTRAAA